MYAIAGVTGHTGAATADALLAGGKPVRVIVRGAEKGARWKARGCEVAVADLGDPTALARALEGVTGAFLLSPPNVEAKDFLADRKALLDRMVDGVKRSKVPQIVFLSSVGAQHAAGTGPIVTAHRAEQALRGIAPSVTFLRAAYFLENWGSVVPLAKAQGIVPHFGPVDYPFAQVCARDIGAAVARALGEAAPGTRVVELAGAQEWSVNDVAASIGTLLGKPVKAVSAPVEAAEAGLAQAGLPPDMARLYAEMYRAAVKGLLAWERPGSLTRGSDRKSVV